jgi:alpha-tubulin suppressor-like RCC1 family protein
MTINRSQLECNLNTLIDVNYCVGSTNPDLILATSLSTCVLNQTNTIVVDSVADLPDLFYYRSPDGMVYFLKDVQVYAVSSGERWITMDGRLLRSDKRSLAFGWGSNGYGRLGDNTTTDRSSPVSVVGGFTDWCQVSAGSGHSLGIRRNGTLWAWGYNYYGFLGDNSTVDKSSPVSVSGGFSDWCRTSAGRNHSLAVRTNGSLWAWGSNISFGKLGDGTTETRSSPVSVVGGFSDWCDASAGCDHSLGVRTNGTLWAWGNNNSGRLGDGTAVEKSSPVSVVGGFTDWCQSSAGGQHSLGVRSNGTLWAWGSNFYGRLGDNTVTDRSSPVSVVGGFSDWCQASAGYSHSLAVRTNGSLWAWGLNDSSGKLGDNTTTSRSSPVSVVGGFTDWCQVSAGYGHSLAVRTNGTLWAWGSNGYGKLGDNTTSDKSSPVSVVGGFSDWCAVSAGLSHSLGIRAL